MAYTVLADIVVPEVFSPYMQMMTEVKSKLAQSGVLARDATVDQLMSGGGLTFNLPKWNDLADTAANVSSGNAGAPITPLNISSLTEIAIRLSRNQAWGSGDLLATLAGSDPMEAIASRVSDYWVRQLQLATLATLAGVFSDNDTNDAGDYTIDITGAYTPGTTDFSAGAFIDAVHTMGDSEGDLGIVVMHSVVYAKAKKNNLIDFIPDSINPQAATIPTFLGRRVLFDDGMPVNTADYDTYILGAGALSWGVGNPKIPSEVYRLPLDAAGGGTDALVSRVEWVVAPRGHAFTGATPAAGGPTNAATAGNLAHVGSWNRVVSERKQVKIARLRTTEA